MSRKVFLEVVEKALAAGADPAKLARDAATSADNLNAEIAQKDETIQRLREALTAAKVAMHRGEFGDKGRDRDVPAQVDAALRMDGVLK